MRAVPALALILGGLGFAEARPEWSLGFSLAGGSYNGWRGPYSLGIRAIVGADENSQYMPHVFYRSLGSVFVLAKSSALMSGPLDLFGLAGVGYEDILSQYEDDRYPWEPSHPDLLPDKHFHSPVFALGWSKK